MNKTYLRIILKLHVVGELQTSKHVFSLIGLSCFKARYVNICSGCW